jgi:TRAP-type C4-dicarboxylate transport system permease large subunit
MGMMMKMQLCLLQTTDRALRKNVILQIKRAVHSWVDVCTGIMCAEILLYILRMMDFLGVESMTIVVFVLDIVHYP